MILADFSHIIFLGIFCSGFCSVIGGTLGNTCICLSETILKPTSGGEARLGHCFLDMLA